MKIFIEESLFVCFVLNFLCLKLTAKIRGQKARFLILVSLLSSAISIVSPIWMMSPLIKLCFTLCLILAIILVSFKYKSFKDFLLNFSIFLFSAFLLGGGCFAVKECFGSYPLLMVVIIASGIYLIMSVVLKLVSHFNRLKSFTYKITFKDNGRVINEEGYLDSGNVLYDCITKKPIVLVTYDVFHKLYENISYLSLITKDFDENQIKNAHFMKINGIGKGTKMLIFTIDELCIESEDKCFKDATLGLSFSGFEKSFGRNVLLHCDYC